MSIIKKQFKTKSIMNIEDYLSFYIGCQVIGTYNDVSGSKGYLTGVTNGGNDCEIQFILEDGINVEEEPQFNESNEVKLMLRPLNDMSADEAWQCFSEANDDSHMTNPKLAIQDETWFPSWNIHQWAAALNYLRKQGFDCDGLIKAGIAIEFRSEIAAS